MKYLDLNESNLDGILIGYNDRKYVVARDGILDITVLKPTDAEVVTAFSTVLPEVILVYRDTIDDNITLEELTPLLLVRAIEPKYLFQIVTVEDFKKLLPTLRAPHFSEVAATDREDLAAVLIETYGDVSPHGIIRAFSGMDSDVFLEYFKEIENEDFIKTALRWLGPKMSRYLVDKNDPTIDSRIANSLGYVARHLTTFEPLRKPDLITETALILYKRYRDQVPKERTGGLVEFECLEEGILDRLITTLTIQDLNGMTPEEGVEELRGLILDHASAYELSRYPLDMYKDDELPLYFSRVGFLPGTFDNVDYGNGFITGRHVTPGSELRTYLENRGLKLEDIVAKSLCFESNRSTYTSLPKEYETAVLESNNPDAIIAYICGLDPVEDKEDIKRLSKELFLLLPKLDPVIERVVNRGNHRTIRSMHTDFFSKMAKAGCTQEELLPIMKTNPSTLLLNAITFIFRETFEKETLERIKNQQDGSMKVIFY